MKASRVVYLVHSWSGLLTGWILFLICLTGTLVVYKFPLKALANPGVVHSHVDDRIGPDGALAAFQAAHPNARPTVVAFPSDAFSIHQYSVLARKPGEGERRYWIDPSSGALRGELQSDFADFIQRLHAGLFMGRVGRWMVGGFGVVMAVSLVSGLVFHWKRIRRDLFNLRLNDHTRKAWSDLHKFAGVWAIPFHLVIVLTGAWLGLETLIRPPGPPSEDPIEIKGEGPGAPLTIAELTRRATELYPDLRPSHINFTNLGVAGSTVRVQGDLPGERLVQRGQTMIVMDADTGRHIQTIDRLEQGLGRRLLAMMRPLHYGYFWPGVSEAIYFVLGFACTLLPVSGLLIWAEREKRRTQARDDHRPTRMERANVAVMGGAILGLVLMALLNAVARIEAASPAFALLGGLDFNGSQDVLSGRPLALELPVFAGVSILAGLLLCLPRPETAWRACVLAAAAILLALPLLGIAESGDLGGYLRRGGGEAVGYALLCACLGFACFAIAWMVRRTGLRRARAN